MNSKFNKYCAVPQCANSSKNTPKKLFIHVPRSGDARKCWLKLARRDPAGIAPQSRMYFCEDHFDLPNDMVNYTEYHVMGLVSKIQMRAGCLPTKFTCQPERNGQRLETLREIEKEMEQANTPTILMAKDQQAFNTDNVAEVSSEALVQMEVVYVKQEPAWEDRAARAGAGSSQGFGVQQESGLQHGSATQADPLASPRKPYACDTCSRQFKTLSDLQQHVITHTDERPFECYSCHKRFKLYNTLKVHQRTHSDQEPYACEIRNKNFTEITTVQSHERSHAGDKPYSCNMCDKTFTYPNNLKKHCQKHHGIQPDLKCVQVNKCCAVPLCASNATDTPDKLFIHIPRTGASRDQWLRFARRDPLEVAPRCTMYFCEDHFDMPKDMLNYTEYRVMGSVARVLMRPGCFPTKFASQSDRQTRTDVQNVEIDKGTEQTDFTLNMPLHEDQAANTGYTVELSEVKEEVMNEELSELYAGHDVRGDLVLGPAGVRRAGGAGGAGGGALTGDVKQEPVWGGGECAQEFTNTHVAVNTESTEEGQGRGEDTPLASRPPRPKVSYTCNTCGRHFRRGSPYYEHLRVHSGERPYVCDMCNKRFKQLSTMKVHRRTHTGEHPFSCNTCHKTFLRLRCLQRHELTHTGEKPYSCDTCKVRFAQLSYLKAHVIRMHTGERPYVCGRCTNGYRTAKDLAKHERRHDEEKTYSCEICEKEFTTIGGLKTHKWWVHSKSKKQKDKSISLYWHRKTAKDSRSRRCHY